MGISILERLNSKLMETEAQASPQANRPLFQRVFSSYLNAKMTIRDYFSNPAPAVRSSSKTNFKREVPNSSFASPIDPQSAVSEMEGSKPYSKKITPEIQAAIEKAAQDYQVPQKLIESMIHAESNFNPKATSPVGAMGLMQLMPKTAHELGVKKPYDIGENIDGGVRYFRKLLDRFGQSTELALAAYNAGQGNVIRYGGIPPYRETQNYVSKILKNYHATTV